MHAGGILAEEVRYAAFGATEVENIQLLMAPKWRVWQDFLLAAAKRWDAGEDENSAIALAPHKENWIGQMMHMIWANPSHRLGQTGAQ